MTHWTTAFTRLAGTRLPIVQAPMAGGWTTPELAAAVSEAGGLGMLAASRLTADELRRQIAEVRHRTRRPFGINLQVPEPDPPSDDAAFAEFAARRRSALGLPAPGRPPAAASAAEVVSLVVEHRVPVLTVAMGSPAAVTAMLAGQDILLGGTATTVAEARECAAAGARFVVAQGSEAGGHRSTFQGGAVGDVPLIGTLALVPQVVDEAGLPVVAAGGIMDGRGLAAALALGAAAAQLGTRFLLARESGTPPGYRRRLLQADETATVVTRAFTGRPARSLTNGWISEFERAGLQPVGWPRQAAIAGDIYRTATARDDPDNYPLLAGQGLRLARNEAGAAEIVAELVAGAREALARVEAG